MYFSLTISLFCLDSISSERPEACQHRAAPWHHPHQGNPDSGLWIRGKAVHWEHLPDRRQRAKNLVFVYKGERVASKRPRRSALPCAPFWLIWPRCLLAGWLSAFNTLSAKARGEDIWTSIFVFMGHSTTLALLSLSLAAIARQPETPEVHLSVSEEEARKRFYRGVTVVCFHSSPVTGKCTWPLKCAWSAVPNGLIEVYETNYSVWLKLIPIRKPLMLFSFYTIYFIYFSSWFCSVKCLPLHQPHREQRAWTLSLLYAGMESTRQEQHLHESEIFVNNASSLQQ